MDTKRIAPHEDTDKVIGCTVMVIGGILLLGLVILIVGVIDEWVVNDAMPALSGFWRWMTHSKGYRIAVVISAIFGLLAFFIPLQKPRFYSIFACVLQALVFAICSFFACFFVFVAIFEIVEWIEKGYR